MNLYLKKIYFLFLSTISLVSIFLSAENAFILCSAVTKVLILISAQTLFIESVF